MHVLEIWFIKSEVPYRILLPLMLSIRDSIPYIRFTALNRKINLPINKKDFKEMSDWCRDGSLKIVNEEPCKEHKGKIKFILDKDDDEADKAFGVLGFAKKAQMKMLRKIKLMDYKRYET